MKFPRNCVVPAQWGGAAAKDFLKHWIELLKGGPRAVGVERLGGSLLRGRLLASVVPAQWG